MIKPVPRICPNCGHSMYIAQVDTITFWCFTLKHFQVNCQSVHNDSCPWFDWWMITKTGAILRWNWRQWRARRKCGTCRYGKDRNDNGLSVECRCIISPKYRLAMSAEKHHCWAWLEGRKMKGEKKA